MPIEKGHNFEFDETPCTACGMTRTYYDDHDQPGCLGIPFEPEEDQEPRPRPG